MRIIEGKGLGGAEKAGEVWGGEAGGGELGEEEQKEEEVLLTTGPLGQSAMGTISV